ncbi:MAG: glycosyltransferase, partial [Phycisphaerae bacterium]
MTRNQQINAMKIAILGGREWEVGATAEGFDVVALPSAVPVTPGEEPQARIAALTDAGGRLLTSVERAAPDLLLDTQASGLSFVQGARGIEELKLTHEAAGLPLVSYFDGSVVKIMQGLPWATVWQILQSKTWTKGLTDARHAAELRAFGIPEVREVLAAAVALEPSSDPVKREDATLAVSFVGNAGLSEVLTVSAGSQMESWIGMAAAAVGGYPEAPCFFDIYHALYSCGEMPTVSDAYETLAEKAAVYFRARQRYIAELSFRARDRFVVFLARKIPAQVLVSGAGWRDAYGMDAGDMIDDPADRAKRYRSAAINIGLPDPNSELGFDPRCLEIAAAGGFLLCFHTHDIDSYFEVGRECATFRDEQELLERISEYLADPQKRTRIAHAGQARVLQTHLIRHRIRALVDDVARVTNAATTDAHAAQGNHGGAGGTVAKLSADIDAALEAIGQDASPDVPPNNGPPRVVDEPERLMVLLNPGRFTRHYLEDIATAAEALGIETVRFEMGPVWQQSQAGQAPDAAHMAR